MEQLTNIGLDKKKAEETLKNKKLTTKILSILKTISISECAKSMGILIYSLASKIPSGFEARIPLIAGMIKNEKIKTSAQLEAAIAILRWMVLSPTSMVSMPRQPYAIR